MSTANAYMPVPRRTSVPEYAQNVWDILSAGGGAAAKALVDIAKNGKDERARVTAAEAVLNRIGFPAQTDIGVFVQEPDEYPTDRASDVVRERLRLLREQAIEGEVVVVPFPQLEEVT